MKKANHTTHRQAYPFKARLFSVLVTLLVGFFMALPTQAQQQVTFDATEASPESSIVWLRTQVEDVINSESLSKESNAARHLLHYLDRALGTYLKGMPAHSARHMGIFIAKVERLQNAHRVSEELCVLLIDTSLIVVEKLNAESALAEGGSAAVDSQDAEKIASEESSTTVLSNSPNPFNPTTTIRFTVEQSAQVNLTVYDLTGREVHQLVNGYTNAGNHEVTFDASNLPSGTYLYRLTTPESQVVQKMVLLK